MHSFNQSVKFHVINRSSATHKPKPEDGDRMVGKRMKANEWVLTLKISKSTAPYAVPCYLKPKTCNKGIYLCNV